MTKFQKQVEVQGTKKLDSVKGVQTLELKEMKETEGGAIPILIKAAVAYFVWESLTNPKSSMDSWNRGLKAGYGN